MPSAQFVGRSRAVACVFAVRRGAAARGQDVGRRALCVHLLSWADEELCLPVRLHLSPHGVTRDESGEPDGELSGAMEGMPGSLQVRDGLPGALEEREGLLRSLEPCKVLSEASSGLAVGAKGLGEIVLQPVLRHARVNAVHSACARADLARAPLRLPRDLERPLAQLLRERGVEDGVDSAGAKQVPVVFWMGRPVDVPEAAVAEASDRLMSVLNCSSGAGLGSSVMYDGAIGQLCASVWERLPPQAAEFLRLLHRLVSRTPTAALFKAILWLIAPTMRLRDLIAVSEQQFFQISTIYLAAVTMAHIRLGRIDVSGMRKLRCRRSAQPRAEWARVFGLSLRRPVTWPQDAEEFATVFRGGKDSDARMGSPEALRILEAVRAQGDSLAGLNLRQVLLVLQPLAQPGANTNPLMLGGWSTPFAWFIRSNVHFALAPTREAIHSLAAYLQSRRETLISQPRRDGQARSNGIVEVGAGSGQLAALLNATGKLSPPLIATEPFPDGYARAEATIYGASLGGELFCDIDAVDAEGAIAKHRPAIVLCAFMTAGEDWTPAWRVAGVEEYVLIGDLGEGPMQYSLNRCDHGEYKRVLLSEVSADLLEAGQAALEGDAAAEGGYLVAMSFRRPRM